ncbi:MAG: GAF domain-containing protein [Deltaproteobacteria bacterium]|nr:GAF domain-containing protein [Deltaproteobacteria bacterium]
MSERNNYFKSICRVSRAFSTTLELDEILDLIVKNAIETMDAKAACLFLAFEEDDIFVPAARQGLSQKYMNANPLHVSESVEEMTKNGYLFISDATSDPRVSNHQGKKEEGIASILVVPVTVKDRIIGALSLYTATPRVFSKDDIEFLSALAEQGGMAIENSRLVKRMREQTQLFLDLSANINSSFDLRSILHILTADIADSLGVKAASIRLLDEKRKRLKLVASYGLSEAYLKKGPISAEKSIAEAVKGVPVVVRNPMTDPGVEYRAEKEQEGIASILCVPIESKDEVIGVLRLYSGVPRDFTEDEIMFVTALAHQGGLAIQNATLYAMLKDDIKDMEEDMWSHRSWF